ncbi:MAG: divalent-cation tolerance protein CutA [Candidatus Omnitrophica bacterium]|nr:divalent-cation tolerance protein CutA [Candidatus Omnitrophota bacterium]
MQIVVFITCSSKLEGRRIARALVEKRLAACVNIVDKIESIFCWKGKIEKAKEALLIVKSQKKKFTKIIKLVRTMHSYEVPEIIAFRIFGGDKRYLKWIDETLR